jgi:hypothetical protein
LKIVDLARQQAIETGVMRRELRVLSYAIAISHRDRAVGATLLRKIIKKSDEEECTFE